jgi:hypothetical protein
MILLGPSWAVVHHGIALLDGEVAVSREWPVAGAGAGATPAGELSC